MTTRQTWAFTIGFSAMMLLAGYLLVQQRPAAPSGTAATAVIDGPGIPDAEAAPDGRVRANARAAAATVGARVAPTVAPLDPQLLERLQPLLNKGADMRIAADGFSDAEAFASVAHAARNLQVPFMVLKHRVVEQQKPLPVALAELAPRVDAAIEADRARAEARSDLAAVAG